jgi:hypothetical protein
VPDVRAHGRRKDRGMTTPSRPEADMLHMQHAQLAALLARQQEAARQRAQRDVAVRKIRTAAAPAALPETVPARQAPRVRVHGPRPA